MTRREARDETPTFRLVLAWSVVGIPLLWGVIQTLMKALALLD